MARIRTNSVEGTLTNAINDSETNITSDGLADLDVVGGGDIAPITMGEEVMHVTSHGAGSTTASVTRGQEGTTAVAHSAGEVWHHGPTTQDYDLANLNDVNINAQTDGQVLTWVAANSRWENAAGGGGGGSAADAAIIIAANDAPQKWKDVADHQCDGTADDVEINAAFATDGVTFRLSPGTFNISANLSPPPTCEVIGAGAGVTILKAVAGLTGASMYGDTTNYDHYYHRLVGVTFDTSLMTGTVTELISLQAYGGGGTAAEGHIIVDSIEVKGNGATDMVVLAATRASFTNSAIHGTDNTADGFKYWGDNWDWGGCSVTNSSFTGLQNAVTTAFNSGHSVSGCYFYNNSNGIVGSNNALLIEGNHFWTHTQSAIALTGNGNNSVYANNRIEGCGGASDPAIDLGGSTNITCTGNYVGTNNGAIGIAALDYTTVTGNFVTVNGATAYGIQLTGTEGGTCVGNQVSQGSTAAGARGIYVTGDKYAISGNRVWTAAGPTAAIELTATAASNNVNGNVVTSATSDSGTGNSVTNEVVA